MRVERAHLPLRFDIDMDAFGCGRKRSRDDDDVEIDTLRSEKVGNCSAYRLRDMDLIMSAAFPK